MSDLQLQIFAFSLMNTQLKNHLIWSFSASVGLHLVTDPHKCVCSKPKIYWDSQNFHRSFFLRETSSFPWPLSTFIEMKFILWYCMDFKQFKHQTADIAITLASQTYFTVREQWTDSNFIINSFPSGFTAQTCYSVLNSDLGAYPDTPAWKVLPASRGP